MSAWLVTSADPPGRLSVEAGLSAALIATLRPDTKEERPASAPAVDAVEDGRYLRTDVELEVSLRFGRRRMSLRDILELSVNAVVELDRQVQEPVELLLDDKIVARGEAMLVNGNYALRVTDLML
jgi:flagellar motor switch protein FliN/FliY